MPIDSNIYARLRSPDIGGAYEDGLKMKDLARKREQEEEAITKQRGVDEAYKAGVVENADGTVGFDKTKTLSALAKLGGKEYLDAKSQFSQQEKSQTEADRAAQIHKLEMIGRLAGSATDQKTYEAALAEAPKYGLDVSGFPKAFDPGLIERYRRGALSAKDQLEQQNKERDFGLKQQELSEKKAERLRKANSGEDMALDKKKTVETLAAKNANKISIKNQIDAVLGKWDGLSDDQKVAAGRQLLKTLNSTEGADAIGSEEASRLGSKLEFAFGNITNSNPTQFGRDLKGFFEQAKNVSGSIKTAVASNQTEIDKAMGRKVQTPFADMSDDDIDALYTKMGGK